MNTIDIDISEFNLRMKAFDSPREIFRTLLLEYWQNENHVQNLWCWMISKHFNNYIYFSCFQINILMDGNVNSKFFSSVFIGIFSIRAINWLLLFFWWYQEMVVDCFTLLAHRGKYVGTGVQFWTFYCTTHLLMWRTVIIQFSWITNNSTFRIEKALFWNVEQVLCCIIFSVSNRIPMKNNWMIKARTESWNPCGGNKKPPKRI